MAPARMAAGHRFPRLGRCLFPRFITKKLKRKSAKRKVASASACTSEGYGILRRQKEAMAALDLLELKDAPGGMDILMDRWKKLQAEAARPLQKGKKVVKRRLPNALVEQMAARPFRSVQDLTPLQLSKRSPQFRQLYAVTSFVEGKMRDHQQALVDQYNALGYAEDEMEVTDDEEDDKVDDE